MPLVTSVGVAHRRHRWFFSAFSLVTFCLACQCVDFILVQLLLQHLSDL